MATMSKGAVGTVDRAIRAVLGVALLAYAIFGGGGAAEAGAAAGIGTLEIVLGLVGVVLLGTAAIRFCPLYRILGVCTG